MKKVSFILSLILFSAIFTPAQAAQCKDGTYSSSTGRGTCSRHGGVASWGSSSVQSNAVNALLQRQKQIDAINKANQAAAKKLQEKADAEARAAGYKNAAAKIQAEKIAEQKRIAAENAEQQRIETELEIERLKADTDAEILRIQNAKILEDKLNAERVAAQDKLAAANNVILLAKQEKQLNPNNPRQYVVVSTNLMICNEFGGTYTRPNGCQGFIICEQSLANNGYAADKVFNGPMRNMIEYYVASGHLRQTPDNPSCALIKGTLTPGKK